MKIKAILKLTLLTCIFFGMIVYVTATPPKKIDTKVSEIKINSMPQTIKLLDDETLYATSSIIKENTIIAVANHDSIVVLKELDKYLDNVVIVSNIAAAPWFVKQWIIPSKLKELKGSSKTPWIYDEDGSMKSYLKITNDQATNFVIFKRIDEKIEKVFESKVKVGALDGSMSDDEIKKQVLDIIAKIK
jgi:hypothetical protein